MTRTFANYNAVHQILDAPQVLRERGVGASAFLVLLIIARHHGDQDGYCWLSYTTICRETLLNRRTVISAVNQLCELGFLRVRGDVDKPSNTYTITLSLESDKDDPRAGWSEANQNAPGVLWSEAGALLFEAGALSSGVATKVHHEVVQGSMTERGGSEGSPTTPIVISGCAAQEDSPDEESGIPEHDMSSTPKELPPTPPPSLPPSSVFGSVAARVVSEAEQLSLLFFGFQGCPAELDNKATFDCWVNGFSRLIQLHGFADLVGAMRWAFEVDTFWPKHLIRSEGQLAYFEEKLASRIKTQYLGWKTAQDNAAKQQKKGNLNGKPSTHHPTGKQPFDHRAEADAAKRLIATQFQSAG